LNDTHEIIDGVNIVRHGGFYTVYIWAPLYYLTKLRGKYDVIIDSENGIPFFTPLFVKKPIIGIVHHVHQEIIIEQLAISWYLKPVAYLAKLLETKLMPLVYRDVQMITVSNSTLSSMNKIGLGKRKNIEIVHPGVELEKFKPGIKTQHPSILYLGRIKPYKSIEVAINAVNELRSDIPEIELKIAGFGEHQLELEKLVLSLGLEQNVTFTGHVTEDEKVSLMSEAWAFIYPSLWEGWGISVIEASASGTPVVASNVPGLRDSVSNPHSGYLVEYGNVHGFAEKLRLILTDSQLRSAFGRDGIEWANNFTWEKSTKKLLDIIRKAQNV
jgi:glycosyltransferase involved in cell wall biosynthesis